MENFYKIFPCKLELNVVNLISTVYFHTIGSGVYGNK
jgi:hypothetical protein